MVNLLDPDLAVESNAFFEVAYNSCGYDIYDGYDYNSYESVMKDIVSEIQKDKYFIIWLAFFYVTFSLIIFLFVNPKHY